MTCLSNLVPALQAWMCSWDWENILGSIVVSVLASAVFWVLTFRISLTDVRFSLEMEKSPSITGRPSHRYRVRFANLGTRDLIEVSIIARVRIQREITDQITYLNCGDQNFLPILRRRPRWFSGKHFQIPTMTLSPSDVMVNELTKLIYTDHIRVCAKNKTVSLDDLFEEYQEKISIQLFLYGNDCVTGARRLFESPLYTVRNIREGQFHSLREIHSSPFCGKKNVQEFFSQIDPLPPQ